MTLDIMSLARFTTGRLDNIGIDCPLSQPLGIGQFFRLFFENINEQVAYNFALLFRVSFTRELAEETVLSINAENFDTQTFCKGRHNLVAFAETQETIVDKHTGKLITNSTMNQSSGHRGVDPTGEAKDNFFTANLFPDPANSILDNLSGRPFAGAATNFTYEGINKHLAARSMVDFGMELHTIEVTLKILDATDRSIFGDGNFFKAPGLNLDMITMAHPDRAMTINEEAVKKRAGSVLGDQVGVAVLTLACRHDPAAEVVTHQLHAVTDTQNRDSQLEKFFFNSRSPLFVD